MGVIYQAISVANNKKVAIKEMSLKQSQREALITEMAIMKRAKHRCVVEFHDAYKKDADKLWVWRRLFARLLAAKVVMELMDAGCLTDVLDEFEDVQMAEKEIALVAYDVLCGLKHMHELNFVHRDIKSDNVLLNSRGEVKLGTSFFFVRQPLTAS